MTNCYDETLYRMRTRRSISVMVLCFIHILLSFAIYHLTPLHDFWSTREHELNDSRLGNIKFNKSPGHTLLYILYFPRLLGYCHIRNAEITHQTVLLGSADDSEWRGRECDLKLYFYYLYIHLVTC